MDFKTQSWKTLSSGLTSKFLSLFCHNLAIFSHFASTSMLTCFTVVASFAQNFSWPLGHLVNFFLVSSLCSYITPLCNLPQRTGATEELWPRCSLCNLYTPKLTPSIYPTNLQLSLYKPCHSNYTTLLECREPFLSSFSAETAKQSVSAMLTSLFPVPRALFHQVISQLSLPHHSAQIFPPQQASFDYLI